MIENNIPGPIIPFHDNRIASGSPSDGDILVFDGETGKYVNKIPPVEGKNIEIKKLVPSEYTVLGYVSNASSTYINTLFVPDVDDIELEITVIPSSGSWYIFQSRTSSVLNGVTGASSGNKISFAFGGTTITSSISRSTTSAFTVRAKAKNGNMSLYVKKHSDGTEDTKTGTYTYTQQTLPFWMFGNQNSNYVNQNNRISRLRAWKEGIPYLDYIPVKRNSDNAVGFYDRVTKTFVTATSGSLNGGSEIETPYAVDFSLDFAKVAATGNYNDLSNKPTIPENQILHCTCILNGSHVSVYDPSLTNPISADDIYDAHTDGKVVVCRVIVDANPTYDVLTILSCAGLSYQFKGISDVNGQKTLHSLTYDTVEENWSYSTMSITQSSVPSFGSPGYVLAVNANGDGMEWVPPSGGGTSSVTSVIPSGNVSSNSTATAKSVTISGIAALENGLIIQVKNNSVRSASGVQLNLNNLGATRIYCNYNGTAKQVTNEWRENGVFLLVYNTRTDSANPRWDIIGYVPKNIEQGFGILTCNTAAGTAAKTASTNDVVNYSPVKNSYVSVKFTHAVSANATLNIDSTGDVPLYYRGSAIINNIIKANDIATFVYNGTNYNLVSVDRWGDDIGNLSAVAISGDYRDLENTPQNLSDFNNDTGFVPYGNVPNYVGRFVRVCTMQSNGVIAESNICPRRNDGDIYIITFGSTIPQAQNWRVCNPDSFPTIIASDYCSPNVTVDNFSPGDTCVFLSEYVTATNSFGITSSEWRLNLIYNSRWGNLKTVNGISLLGTGDIPIVGWIFATYNDDNNHSLYVADTVHNIANRAYRELVIINLNYSQNAAMWVNLFVDRAESNHVTAYGRKVADGYIYEFYLEGRANASTHADVWWKLYVKTTSVSDAGFALVWQTPTM